MKNHRLCRWVSFCLYGKRAAEKICLLPIYAEPAETGRQALLHSPLRAPSQANAQATRRELQDSRSYACGCVPNVQLLRKRKRQHLTKAEQPNVLKRESATRKTSFRQKLRYRKTRPLNASHEPFLEQFQFEMLCISNHTACRFSDKTFRAGTHYVLS